MTLNNRYAQLLTASLTGLSAYFAQPTWADEHLYLELVVNQTAKQAIIEIKPQDNKWYAKRSELLALNLTWTLPEAEWIALDDLPDTEWKYYAVTQRLHLSIAPKYLPLQDLRDSLNERPKATRDSGAYLNYSVYYNDSSTSGNSTSVWHSLNGFSPSLYWQSSGIYRKGTEQKDDYIRYDSSLHFDFESIRTELQFGDVINGGREYLPSYRIGGIRIARDFSLEPDRSFFPLPEFIGEAEVPSGLDVYINNQRMAALGVESGPYRLSLENALTGFNTATIVTTDVQGRPITQTVNFYLATNLLEKGLWDYDFSTGYVREKYGERNFEYGSDLLSTGRAAYGFSNYITGEVFAQNIRDITNVGGGLRVALGTLGTASATYAESMTDDYRDGGSLKQFGYDFSRFGFGFYINHQSRDENYADIVDYQLSSQLKSQTVAGMSLNFRKLGQVSISRIRRNYWSDAPAPIDAVDDEAVTENPFYDFGRDSDIWQLNWNRSISSDTVLSARAQHFDNSGENSFSLGITHYFGRRMAASVQTQQGETRSNTYVNVAQNSDYPYGVGWSLSAGDAPSDPRYGDIRVRHPYGSGAFRAGHTNYERYTAWEWSGSLVVMDKEFYLAPSIYDAFAVVDTQLPNVPIYAGYQDFGPSSGSARRLIPDLAGYLNSNVRIDPMDLPENMNIPETSKTFRPRRHGGVYVKFDLKQVTQVHTKIFNTQNQPLPVGTTLFNREGNSVWIGWDGELFIPEASSHQKWQWPDGECTVLLPKLTDTESNYLDPLICIPDTPPSSRQ